MSAVDDSDTEFEEETSMPAEIKQAVEFYDQACLAEQQDKDDLAEVYYLKSWALFEQAGGRHYLNAANSLNALAYLRKSRGNFDGALLSAKRSLQFTEKYDAPSNDADLIRGTARDLIDLVCGEMSAAARN